jgi:CHAD domain-containing protein
MKAPFPRWIEETSPADRTLDVASCSLGQRLAAVQYYLPLAAEKADEDVEYIHQLRVWVRRTLAALKLYRDLLPRRKTAWLRRHLRRIHHAANEARDCDVLTHRLNADRSHLAKQRFLEHIRAQRRQAQQPLIEIHEQLRRHHVLERRVAKLLKRIRSRPKQERRLLFGAWAQAHSRPIIRQFFAAAPTGEEDGAALHQFRIRGKELRYAMELLVGAFPPEFRTQLYPIIEELQEQLGSLNDHETAQDRLRQRIDATTDAAEIAELQILLAEEEAHFHRVHQRFLRWWSEQGQDGLRRRFKEVLSGRLTPAGV